MGGRLNNSSAIITGAARGIGFATAQLFLQEGARVGLIDRDKSALVEAVQSLTKQFSGSVVHWYQAEIGDPNGITLAIDMLVGQLGKLDILVNNAAARAFGPIAETTPESWSEILQTNVTGLAMCARAALPTSAQEQERQHRQRIVDLCHRRPAEHGPVRCEQSRDTGFNARIGM